MIDGEFGQLVTTASGKTNADTWTRVRNEMERQGLDVDQGGRTRHYPWRTADPLPRSPLVRLLAGWRSLAGGHASLLADRQVTVVVIELLA